jgi:hypothetical protein
MGLGTCDPATRGEPYNVTTLEFGGGAVTIDVRWDWDGVSVRPDCDGPIRRVRTTNSDSVSWYVHTVGKRGQPRDIELPAGQVRIWNAAQLSSAGYDTITDLENLTLTSSPTRLRP